MSLIRLDPFGMIRPGWPFDDNDLQLSSWSTGTGDNLEVYEEDDKVVVKAKVAGVTSDNVEVTFQDGRLWIKAEATDEQADKKQKYYKKMSRQYSYVVDLPDVDPKGEAKEASLDKGVLTLVFDKAAEAKPKKITVKSK